MALYVSNGENPLKKTALYTAGNERKVFRNCAEKTKTLFLLLATN